MISIPDSASFRVDLRSVPGLEHARLLEAIKDHLGPDIEIERLIDLPGILTSATDPWIIQVLDIMVRIQGSRPEPGYVNYFTDASVLTSALNNPPTLILGPGEPSQAHQTNEYCDVEKIVRSVAFYRATPITFDKNICRSLFAHALVKDSESVSGLFGKTTISEIKQQMLCVLKDML